MTYSVAQIVGEADGQLRNWTRATGGHYLAPGAQYIMPYGIP